MRSWLLPMTVGSFVAGAAVMVIFDGPLARVAGVMALGVFMVAGLFLVADPERLAERDPDEAGRRRR